jgi:hypothetical protein
VFAYPVSIGDAVTIMHNGWNVGNAVTDYACASTRVKNYSMLHVM